VKVLVAGDTHGNRWTRHVLRSADKLGISDAIIVGDCWDVHQDYSEFKARPHFVAGNHEQPLYWEAGKALGRCHDDYSTFELGGRKFGVLGHIDEESHKHLKTELPWLYDALGPKPDIWFTHKPIEEVKEIFRGIDVLLTHDAAYPINFISMGTGEPVVAGSKYLTQVLEAVQPKLSFGGHFHHYEKRQFGATTRYQLNQQGTSQHFTMGVLDLETMGFELIADCVEQKESRHP
jgi:Icc-related predicted phosphoesterase